MEKEEKRFKVQRIIFETKLGGTVCRHMLTDRCLPMLIPNQYLENKSMHKAAAGRFHAVRLGCFLNYLDEKCGTEYENATNSHVKRFISSLIYGEAEDLKILSQEDRLSYSALSGYVGVITEFYRWLDQNYGSEMTFYEGERRCRAQSYLYGQIYSYRYTFLVNRMLPDTKGSREYIKWYTEDEKIRLYNSFHTLRDEAVFRLTLAGFRIDEVLSIRLSDYDPAQMMIQPARSKRKPDAVGGKENRLRCVRLTEDTCRMIDRYLFEERAPAENESGRISEVMFINLSAGGHMGFPLTYHNFRKILRAAAERAGLDPLKIRTHSGRSTRVMEILEFNAEHPEAAYSETEIRQLFGWACMGSIDPYRDRNSEIMALAAAKRRRKGYGY